jgi:ABC-2 type transport system permease protein
MMTDIKTVAWKEWKEIWLMGGSRGKMTLLVLLGMYGVYLPYQMRSNWVHSPFSFMLFYWMPLMMVASVVADSFAGERERHTLETLLATRLSDTAILVGKVAAAVGYGWGLTMACIIASLVTVNVTNSGHGIQMYSPLTCLNIVLLVLLTSLLASVVGVFFSLRAGTVRQVQQSISLVMIVVIFLPFIGMKLLPQDLQTEIGQKIAQIGAEQAGLCAAGLLVVINAFLFMAASRRFKRSRLILD